MDDRKRTTLKTVKFTILFTLFSLTNSCPDQWLNLENKTCAQFNSTKVSFSEAKRSCEDFSLQLAVVDSVEKEHQLLAYASRKEVGKRFWIEATLPALKDGFKLWGLNGSSLNLTKTGSENCTAIGLVNNANENLVSVPCAIKLPFVCEKSIREIKAFDQLFTIPAGEDKSGIFYVIVLRRKIAHNRKFIDSFNFENVLFEANNFNADREYNFQELPQINSDKSFKRKS
ncbi:hypothetical protein B4U79_17416 [Dinothrombium tinctorium]|uniref:C-type lectin domain-containing protein n=1 Tax=Dinothrombium tinctorium TaxID=1965070 RepID=A0A3S3P2J6_9ACAR|nr:hypothetical protein B4U79_17678 [Dinothrombium tinctorium]RWS10643.1 hypothetical protein B4U79_17588 [Dinothrombium tinctorium]RWS10646.1 hypothetical protein B4U79_17587 [Dinothrombium tinctorium]RWS10647.1 hypothetical protein B4U79_17586 [Dinothrombium tinctorium]RWS10649.1 hypothetical protein B4U79_17585 [Dinothrombium tinctorium]